ncbi:UNVERIFIED_CONTAM: hypothetical protein K2H54_058731 [Gekko kuhli]
MKFMGIHDPLCVQSSLKKIGGNGKELGREEENQEKVKHHARLALRAYQHDGIYHCQVLPGCQLGDSQSFPDVRNVMMSLPGDIITLAPLVLEGSFSGVELPPPASWATADWGRAKSENPLAPPGEWRS